MTHKNLEKGGVLLEALVSLGALCVGFLCFVEILRLLCLKTMLFLAAEDVLRRLQEVHSNPHLWCQGIQQGLAPTTCTPCPMGPFLGECAGNRILNKMAQKLIAQKLTQVPTALMFHRNGRLEVLATDDEGSPFPLRVSLYKEKAPAASHPQLRIKVVVCAPTLFSQLLLDKGAKGGGGCHVAPEGSGGTPGLDPSSPTGKRDGLGQFSQQVSPFSWKLTEHVERSLGGAPFIFQWGSSAQGQAHPMGSLERALHALLRGGQWSSLMSLEK